MWKCTRLYLEPQWQPVTSRQRSSHIIFKQRSALKIFHFFFVGLETKAFFCFFFKHEHVRSHWRANLEQFRFGFSPARFYFQLRQKLRLFTSEKTWRQWILFISQKYKQSSEASSVWWGKQQFDKTTVRTDGTRQQNITRLNSRFLLLSTTQIKSVPTTSNIPTSFNRVCSSEMVVCPQLTCNIGEGSAQTTLAAKHQGSCRTGRASPETPGDCGSQLVCCLQAS